MDNFDQFWRFLLKVQQIQQKFAAKKQCWTVGHQNNKFINTINKKNNNIDNAGRIRANLINFKLNDAKKKSFYTQATNITNRSEMILQKH